MTSRIASMSTGCLVLLLAGQQACAEGRRSADYQEARQVFWNGVYPEGGETLYCGRKFTSGDRAVNIEHVFPMAWAMNAFGCDDRDACREDSRRFNIVESDLHNLFPARVDVNKARGSLPFGMVRKEPRRFGDCDFEIDHRRRVVEPREAVRGDIARAMFYMSGEYGFEIFERQRSLLQKWHRADPPDEEERRRNDVIESLQGNRNPFVDDPALAGG